MDSYIWKILGIIAVALLIIFWRKRNAVWGGLILGILVGSLVAIFYTLKGGGFDWTIIGKVAISAIILGFFAEILGLVSESIKKRGL